MSHYGTLKETRFADASADIRGSHLYGLNDEKLGKIDDVIFDHSTGASRPTTTLFSSPNANGPNMKGATVRNG
jgi:hypothetical protein